MVLKRGGRTRSGGGFERAGDAYWAVGRETVIGRVRSCGGGEGPRYSRAGGRPRPGLRCDRARTCDAGPKEHVVGRGSGKWTKYARGCRAADYICSRSRGPTPNREHVAEKRTRGFASELRVRRHGSRAQSYRSKTMRESALDLVEVPGGPAHGTCYLLSVSPMVDSFEPLMAQSVRHGISVISQTADNSAS